MKQIYTSNYDRCGGNKNAIAISVRVPAENVFNQLPSLAPTWDLVKDYKTGKINDAEYVVKYLTILKERDLTPAKIYDAIPDGAILLCYEKPGQFCHRRVLAIWLQNHLDVEIPEWVSDKETQKDTVVDSLLEF